MNPPIERGDVCADRRNSTPCCWTGWPARQRPHIGDGAEQEYLTVLIGGGLGGDTTRAGVRTYLSALVGGDSGS